MGKSLHAFLPVPRPFQFPGRRKPLVHEDFVVAFAHLRCPSRAPVDHFRPLFDEVAFSAAFVLLLKPLEVAVPGVPADLFQIVLQTGVLVIGTPAAHDGIERREPGYIINEDEASGSKVFDLGLDSFYRLLCRSEVDDPAAFRSSSLDGEAQKVESV